MIRLIGIQRSRCSQTDYDTGVKALAAFSHCAERGINFMTGAYRSALWRRRASLCPANLIARNIDNQIDELEGPRGRYFMSEHIIPF